VQLVVRVYVDDLVTTGLDYDDIKSFEEEMVVVVIVIVPNILQQLLSFCCCFLSVLSCRYDDHDLKGLLLLRNVPRRLMLRLLLRRHISWHQMTDWQMSSALAGCVARTNHLKCGNRREYDNNLNNNNLNKRKTMMKL
jgi:hypothetical protein